MKATDFQISSNTLSIENSNFSKAEIKKEKTKDKSIYTRSRQSSDLTSFSYTPSESLSQTSESVFISYEAKPSQNSYMSNQKKGMSDYFGEIENYYRKTEPEKFYEYKYTKNYLPKEKKEKTESTENKKPNKINNINIPYQNTNNKYDNNMNDYLFQIAQNYYQNLFNGNIIYNIYNNFYLNFPFAFSKAQNDIKKKDNTQNNKETNITEKTEKEKKEQIKEKEEPKEKKEINNDIEIIYVNKKKDKFDESSNRHYSNEDRSIERDYYEPRYSNERSYYNNYRGKRDIYSNGYKRKNLFHEYNNKFNGNFNFEKSRKKFHGENNFYKRKFFQQNYY